MTKKEKLINWAEEKFNNDEDGKIILTTQNIEWQGDGYNTPYLEQDYIPFNNFYKFDECLKHCYYDNLVKKTKELYFEGDNENFEESKRILNKHNIKLEDDCITGCFWQSGKDKEIFN